MLKLPHQAPLLFAREVIYKSKDKAEVGLIFPYIPTLGMLIEAAAQSSAVFCENESEGYLLTASNVTLHTVPRTPSLIASVVCRREVDNLSEIHFEIKEGEALVAFGDILLMSGKSS